jgi:antitoxin MazE
MRVSKWGNGLGIRLPEAVVKALELKEGDRVEVRAAGAQTSVKPRSARSRNRALARLRKLRRPLPKGFVFDRIDANAR